MKYVIFLFAFLFAAPALADRPSTTECRVRMIEACPDGGRSCLYWKRFTSLRGCGSDVMARLNPPNRAKMRRRAIDREIRRYESRYRARARAYEYR